LTTKELKRLCCKWQARLRLSDWDVWVRFAKRDEHEDTWGIIFPQNTTKEAVVIIQNPRYIKNLGPDAYQADVEVTLVHELLHMHFAPLNHTSGSHKEVIEEVIVSHMAQLLVALDRRDETLINPQNPRYLSKVARFS
jgi:hypothetical protein